MHPDFMPASVAVHAGCSTLEPASEGVRSTDSKPLLSLTPTWTPHPTLTLTLTAFLKLKLNLTARSVVDGGATARSTHAPSTANGSADEGSDSEVDQMSPFDVSMARCGAAAAALLPLMLPFGLLFAAQARYVRQ